MSDEVKIKLAALVIIIVVAAIACYSCDQNSWNDGHCPVCGTAWRYEQAVGHRFSTGYIYVCDKCGNHIEISYAPWGEPEETTVEDWYSETTEGDVEELEDD